MMLPNTEVGVQKPLEVRVKLKVPVTPADGVPDIVNTFVPAL